MNDTYIVIMDYLKKEIRVIYTINEHRLEEEHDNDMESYLTEEEGYNSSHMHYMETDDLTIKINR